MSDVLPLPSMQYKDQYDAFVYFLSMHAFKNYIVINTKYSFFVVRYKL